MTKMDLFLPLVLLSISTSVFAADDKASEVTFDKIIPHRENFTEKLIQIEGKIKDLKIIKEGGNKFATFFLSDGENTEATISVKVNLTKKKTVINTFECKNSDFTTVQGRFKSWGNASYLGKVDVRETYQFNCSDTARVRAVAPVEVAMKKAVKKEADVLVENDTPQPTILKISGDGSSKILDVKGKEITKTGTQLAPGTTIKTGPNSNVQLKYPDGSKLSIAPNSKLKTEAGTKTVQSVSLNFGRIHASIHKQASEDLHFRIKTKSATMGVRGTQFFVDATTSGLSTTRVVEGKVDVATDEATLMAGKGRRLLHDQMVEVNQGKILETKPFDSAKFIAKIKSEQPELLAYADADEEKTIVASTAPIAPAVKAVTQKSSAKSDWTVFRLSALGYLTKSDKATFGGMVSWNPGMRLIGNWNLGLDLGYGTRNSAVEYSVVGTFVFNSSIAAEIKAGAQTWMTGTKVTGGMGGLALKYSLCEQCVINHIIFGDDVLSINSKTYNIARVGVGFNF